MQGLGEQITPLVSSSLEMIGKIVIAFTLVPMLGYTGVIVAEPLVWFIMVSPVPSSKAMRTNFMVSLLTTSLKTLFINDKSFPEYLHMQNGSECMACSYYSIVSGTCMLSMQRNYHFY